MNHSPASPRFGSSLACRCNVCPLLRSASAESGRWAAHPGERHHRQVVGDRVGGELGVDLVVHAGSRCRVGAVNDRLAKYSAQPKPCPRPSVTRRVPHRRVRAGVGAGRSQP
jgi:hypothetical protein